ncbi:putative WPP domain-containing protein [Rosa chinensis]|uniref:Putative WPP domain-containing protein n=1 Tax=Rosa chinensis TaxID=74649 RepID=A0A2P6Q0V0_ROSCH|nr:MFP1 attachment factor 1 [Rosa chinensis]XP_024168237.1 MFP1 attachment factor 1 [Rosa chinensis]PRQ27776.1 putative WPP domain-containing protein [Rosa chinensis]
MSDAESTLEAVDSQEPPKQQESQDRKPSSGAAYSLWPPTDRTRNAVVDRLIETLSTPSPLSRRYGTLSADEANEESRRIEQDAFAAAGGSAATEVSGENGMKILQIYSKEISKRMLEVVKAKNAAASAAENGASETAETGSTAAADDAAAVPSEDVKTETEST